MIRLSAKIERRKKDETSESYGESTESGSSSVEREEMSGKEINDNR